MTSRSFPSAPMSSSSPGSGQSARLLSGSDAELELLFAFCALAAEGRVLEEEAGLDPVIGLELLCPSLLALPVLL